MVDERKLQKYLVQNIENFLAKTSEIALFPENSTIQNYPEFLKELISESISSIKYVNENTRLYIDSDHWIVPDILLKDENGRILIVELKAKDTSAKYAITQILSYYDQIKAKYKGSVLQNFVFIVLSTSWPIMLVNAIEVLINHHFPIIPINIVIEERSGEIIDFHLNFLRIRKRKFPWNSFSSEHFRGVHIGWNNKEDVNISTRDLTNYTQLILEKYKIDAIILELNGYKDLTISSDGIAIFILNPFLYQHDNLEEIIESDLQNTMFIMDLIYRISSFSAEDIENGKSFDSNFHFITEIYDVWMSDIYSMINTNGIYWEREIIKLKDLVTSLKYLQRWDVKSVRYSGVIREMIEHCCKWIMNTDEDDLFVFFGTDDLPNNTFGYMISWYCFYSGFANIIFNDWDQTDFFGEHGLIKKINAYYSENT